MKVCDSIECGAFNYNSENHCRELIDITLCSNYKHEQKLKLKAKKQEEDMDDKPCANLDCECFDSREENHCDELVHHTQCGDYKQTAKKQENKKMNEFDNALSKAKNGTLSVKAQDAKEVVCATAKRTKNTVVRVKIGRLAITAIKSALKKTPGLPVYAKLMLESDYADIVIGAIAPIIIPMVTKSPKIIRVSEDINIAGGIAIADKLTFIDNFVAQIMEQVSSAITPEDLADTNEEV